MKKLFTLLTLALLSIGTAWAEDETIFSYTVSSSTNLSEEGWDEKTASGTLGDKCSFYYKSTKGYFQNVGNESAYCFNGSDAAIRLSLTGTNTFKTGDKVTVVYASSGSAARNLVLRVAYKNSTNQLSFGSTGANTNKVTKTVTLTEDFNGLSAIFIERNSSGMNAFSVSVTREVADPESPTCTTSQTTESASIGTPLNLNVTAAHYTGLQWYKAANSNLSDAAAISGATSATYSFTAAKADANKTYYFYCVATNNNATGEKTAQSSTITVNVGNYVASTACELTKIVFSNGFDGFIKLGDTNTITAYYMSGESAPTIASATVSDDATYNLSGNTFTVTAEDGTTTKEFTLSLSSVDPMNDSKITFNGTESWIKTGGAFQNGSKIGWTINKNTEEASNKRISEGKNRIYFFVENATKITIYPSTTNGSNRDVSVTVNNGAAQSMSFPKYAANAKLEITTGAKAMVGITNLGSGDMCIGSISVDGLSNPASSESITPAKTWTTYVPNHDLDFTSTDKLTAYIATDASASSVTLESVDKVPAGTPIVLKATETGSPIAVSLAASTDDVGDNKLKAGDGVTSIGGNNKYDYILKDGAFYHASAGSVAPGKAYLHLDAAPAESLAPFLSIDFGQTTGVNTVKGSEFNVNGEVYNLNGQRVAQPTKGLYIVNGKKVVIK